MPKTPTSPPEPSRFSGTADSVAPAGRIVETTDLTSPEQQARNLEHARLLAEARKTK